MDNLKSTEQSGQSVPVSANGSPVPSGQVETDKRKKGRLGLIIGLAVGIPVVIIAAIFLITFLSPSMVGITEHANDALTQANALSIATAVNAYNALNPSAEQIDTNEELATAAADGSEGVLGNLWPDGISDVDAALGLIEFDDGVAVVTSSSD